jgi:purine nucleoside phosphorylase
MSTIPEALLARHCKMSLFALSLFTKECVYKDALDWIFQSINDVQH